MTKSLARRPLISAAALALFALFLIPVAEEAKAAKKVPTLASSAQYKAFASLVVKLKGLEGKPHTATQKAAFETELTTKHAAAVNKSTALFNRQKQVAKAETQKSFKAASKVEREEEASELADLRGEYIEKMSRAAATNERNLDALDRKYETRDERLRRQIRELRIKKAKAQGMARKDQIQGQINVIIQQQGDSQAQERKELEKIQGAYADRKAKIRAAKAAETAAIRDDRQEDVEALRSKANRTYNRAVSRFRTKRQNQLADLENKLTAGRVSITLIPAAG